jgi:hypothetical protein
VQTVLGKYNLAFVGGNFTQAAAQTLRNYGIINRQGFCSPWYPSFNGQVRAQFLDDSSLYLGGSFSSYNDEEDHYLAKIDYPWADFVVSNKVKLDTQPAISIYPNPNHGQFTLKLGNTNVERIDIVNQAGKKVYSQSQVSDRLSINLDLSPGLYLVLVHSAQGVVSQKMLVE